MRQFGMVPNNGTWTLKLDIEANPDVTTYQLCNSK